MKMPSRCVGNTECSRAGDADVVWKVRVLIDDINEKTEAVTEKGGGVVAADICICC
jgi:hypothetical protein